MSQSSALEPDRELVESLARTIDPKAALEVARQLVWDALNGNRQ